MKENQPIKKGKVTFKTYNQNQLNLLPSNLEELIPSNHLVRVVNQVIDGINLQILEKGYRGGGASSYHPRMMLKVIVYAYSTKIYSCRRIDQALQENIHFMWLSANQKPDFRTINNFRSGRLKALIEEVFNQVLQFLIDNGYVKLEYYFVDGTKMRADANKYTHIWAKNTERYKKHVQEKIKELLKYIDEENEREEAEYGDNHLEEFGENSSLTSQEIQEKIDQINERIKNDHDQLSKKEIIKKNSQTKKLTQYAEKLKKYENQERLLAGRRSYSRTDPDATFMRMKNGDLLPNYTVINGTENQYVINYTIGQSAGEAQDFPTHMEKLKTRTANKNPKNTIADGAFGSEENYTYLEKEDIANYLKYSGIYYENTKRYQQNRFHKDHFDYDAESDSFICPNDQRLIFKEEATSRNANGFIQKKRVYQSQNCEGCIYADQCKKGKKGRNIQFSPAYEKYKDQVRQNYCSTTGISMRKRRGWDVETPFGDIKYNQNYSRFRLRGLEKVNIEWGLLCISHNLRKVAIQAA